ncbi:MAG: AraC family transcriptional regulator, partial [Sphingobacteriales bacterium]
VQRIKDVVSDMLREGQPMQYNFSLHVARLLHYHYTYLSNLFCKKEGGTLESYIIGRRIAMVKGMLRTKSLKEIAYLLNYSSLAHLSAQFKKVTGETATEYKSHLVNQGRPPVKHVSNCQYCITAQGHGAPSFAPAN